MGAPPGLFAELAKWRDKATKRGKPCDFNSDIIPKWLADEVKAVMGLVGVEDTFNFLKATDTQRRRAERRLMSDVQEVLDDFESVAMGAVEEGTQPDYGPLTAALQAIFVPFLTRQYTEEALRVSTDIGIGFDPAFINQEALSWARSYSFDLVSGLTGTTRNVVSDAIAGFIETPGMTQGQIEEILQPAFGQVRAEMIATTETTRAYSQATTAIQGDLNQTGVQMTRIWQTQNDERVCPVCGPLDGTPEQVWSQQFPGGPPAHTRCRCGLVLTSQDDTATLREAIARGRDRIDMLRDVGKEDLIPAAREALADLRARI